MAAVFVKNQQLFQSFNDFIKFFLRQITFKNALLNSPSPTFQKLEDAVATIGIGDVVGNGVTHLNHLKVPEQSASMDGSPARILSVPLLVPSDNRGMSLSSRRCRSGKV
jgi:hypothetical protein